MPGNDFEKQVQKKMDELQFVPSPAVWHEVEKQIAPEKKRRLLVWLPLLGLLLGGAAWMFYAGTGSGEKKNETPGSNISTASSSTGDKNEAIKKSTTSNDKTRNQLVEKPVNITDKKQPLSKEQIIVSPTEIALNRNAATSTGINTNKNRADKNKPKTLVQLFNQPDKRNESEAEKKFRHASGLPKEMVTWKAPGQAENEKVKSYRDAITVNTAGIETNKLPAERIVLPDSATGNNVKISDDTATIAKAAEQPAIIKTGLPDSIKNSLQPDSTSALATKKPSGKKKNSFEWGISVQAGTSNISQGVSTLFKSAPAYDVNSAFANTPSNIPSNSTGGTANSSTTATPSDVHAGFAYAMGVFIRKPVARKLQLMAALNYSYYSTSMQVGSQVINPSLSMLQYSTGSTSKYTNKFHFFELPVTLQKQFGKAARFSVNGGFALSLLTSNTALLYDASQKQYVANDSYINKVQAHVLAGFSYRFFPNSIPVEIGPRFSYGLGNMFKKEMYGSTHLFFAGVQANIFLSKK